MTKQEYDLEYQKMYTEYRKYNYTSQEARTIWKDFFVKHDLQNVFYEYKKAIADRVYKNLGYKLSNAQEKIVKELIMDMVLAKLGKEWLLNHYEYQQQDEHTTNWIFVYYEKEIYLEKMNTRTLEKLKSLGIIEVVEVGGTYSDKIKPLFDFELTEEEKKF